MTEVDAGAPEPEHQRDCGERCAASCQLTPRHAEIKTAWQTEPEAPLELTEQWPRIRVQHVAPVSPETRIPPPLWEWIDDWEMVDRARTEGTPIVTKGEERVLVGLPLPTPATYVAYERADERYSLDRWSRLGGIEDEALDRVRAAAEAEQKSRARRVPDLKDIACKLTDAFGAVIAHPGGAPPPIKKPKKGKVSARMQELLDLVIGEADPGQEVSAPTDRGLLETHHRDGRWDEGNVVSWMSCVHAGLVWGLALLLFGREADPLSEYAFARMLPGRPVRDLRPPFAGTGHLLAAAAQGLPELGGGSMGMEVALPRRRIRARWDECKVSPTHAGTEHVRGEAAVNTVLDARAAVARAGLTEHEQAAVGVLTERGLSLDERTSRLREIEARRRGPNERLFLRSVDERLRDAAYLKELREATADVSDAQLRRDARSARRRLEAAADRTTREADRLVPVRPPTPAQRPPTKPGAGPVKFSPRFRLGATE